MGISPEQWLAARKKANNRYLKDSGSYIAYGPDEWAFFEKLKQVLAHEKLLKTVNAVVELLEEPSLMDLITVDFETYYSRDYSLRKMTTESYIRDPRFEVVGIGVKVNDGDTEWASGTHEQLKEYLHTFDWANSAVLAHNTMFDGAILSWVFDVHPRAYIDTLCMARAVLGSDSKVSLAYLADCYRIGVKGTEVLDALGVHREDFSAQELDKYGDYCVNDVELTYELFGILSKGFPAQELKLIDCTLRMFTEPSLDLDLVALEWHLDNIKSSKELLLVRSGVTKTELMSNPKFAEQLESLGVVPPTKISLATGKETHAFAKSDEGFKELAQHPDIRVQALVAARLGSKSTLEETRTQRFIDISKRGLLPVPVRYYAAHTGRWGGDDKINMQNLPSRGPHGKMLKSCIVAPEGYTLIDCDSSQIEARVLAWVAGQDDLVQAFADKEDVYIKMASYIYCIPEEEITKDQRFVGKTTILGCGYGMGAERFKDQLKSFGSDIDLDEAKRIVDIYRKTNDKIYTFWKTSQKALQNMFNGDSGCFGTDDIVEYEANSIKLPSGLHMRYPRLETQQSEYGNQYSYITRRGKVNIYGGKVTENICQALARCIIGEQMLAVAKRYQVVLTVHDSIICCVPDEELSTAVEYVEKCMRKTPSWANGIPLDCESGTGKNYGACADG